MDQPNSLKIIILIVVMTHGYLKYCNASLLIYRRFRYLKCYKYIVWMLYLHLELKKNLKTFNTNKN